MKFKTLLMVATLLALALAGCGGKGDDRKEGASINYSGGGQDSFSEQFSATAPLGKDPYISGRLFTVGSSPTKKASPFGGGTYTTGLEGVLLAGYQGGGVWAKEFYLYSSDLNACTACGGWYNHVYYQQGVLQSQGSPGTVTGQLKERSGEGWLFQLIVNGNGAGVSNFNIQAYEDASY